MNNTSILDHTILPTLGAAARHTANLLNGTARRQPATPPAANAQPNADNGRYLESMLTWVLGSRADSDDSPDTEPNFSSDSDSGSETGSKPDNSPKPDTSSSSSKQSTASSTNDALNGLDERFIPTINIIILARDRALREGRPIPPAWRRLRRPGDLPLPTDDAANGDAQDRPDERFVPTINRRPLLEEPLETIVEDEKSS
ncbi:hypothetical protein FHL15_008134 [Xylaria flabelliformis]|uniref:Uncharacterized protein n=1 Tax=Xylaria flabelliformis TaxID=2512241 RepID=A0A553HSJ4_9PEZI|nr:hypothetical protein FHL15_008134 [Xylaria flabelliformis]